MNKKDFKIHLNTKDVNKIQNKLKISQGLMGWQRFQSAVKSKLQTFVRANFWKQTFGNNVQLLIHTIQQ